MGRKLLSVTKRLMAQIRGNRSRPCVRTFSLFISRLTSSNPTFSGTRHGISCWFRGNNKVRDKIYRLIRSVASPPAVSTHASPSRNKERGFVKASSTSTSTSNVYSTITGFASFTTRFLLAVYVYTPPLPPPAPPRPQDDNSFMPPNTSGSVSAKSFLPQQSVSATSPLCPPRCYRYLKLRPRKCLGPCKREPVRPRLPLSRPRNQYYPGYPGGRPAVTSIHSISPTHNLLTPFAPLRLPHLRPPIIQLGLRDSPSKVRRTNASSRKNQSGHSIVVHVA